jgi:hypothetical protein
MANSKEMAPTMAPSRPKAVNRGTGAMYLAVTGVTLADLTLMVQHRVDAGFVPIGGPVQCMQTRHWHQAVWKAGT